MSEEATNFITITSDCKTEGQAFYEGETRKVSQRIEGLLCGNGWAKPAPVTLSVDSVKVGVQSEDIANG